MLKVLGVKKTQGQGFTTFSYQGKGEEGDGGDGQCRAIWGCRVEGDMGLEIERRKENERKRENKKM